MVLEKILPAKSPWLQLLFWALALFHLFIPLYNHFLFRTYSYDYAVYNFAFYDFAHFRVSAVPLYHAPYPITFLQDHFSLLLPLLSPLYWVLSPVAGTYSLLVIQWAFIVAGAVFTFRLVKQKAVNDLLPACSLIFYFLLYGRFSAYRSDVNLAIMGSALIPVFLYYFQARRKLPYVIVTVILFITREDFSFWLIFIGLFLAIEYRRNKQLRQRALLLSLLSTAFFVLSMAVLIPFFLENENKKFSLFEYKHALGEDPASAIRYLVHDPVRVFQLLFINHLPDNFYNNIKAEFYLFYFFCGGFLLFTRPHFLIPFIPLLAKKMLNDNPVRWGMHSYYAVEVVSILPILLFIILAGFNGRRSAILAPLLCVMALLLTIIRMEWQPVNAILSEDNKYRIFNSAFYRPEYNTAALRELIRKIPDDTDVSASNRLTPHLAYRPSIKLFPGKSDVGYVLLTKRGDTFPLSQEAYDAEVDAMRNSPAIWAVRYENEKFICFRGVADP